MRNKKNHFCYSLRNEEYEESNILFPGEWGSKTSKNPRGWGSLGSSLGTLGAGNHCTCVNLGPAFLILQCGQLQSLNVYSISMNVSFLELFPPLNSFHVNNSIYFSKDCHFTQTNCCLNNILRKYSNLKKIIYENCQKHFDPIVVTYKKTQNPNDWMHKHWEQETDGVVLIYFIYSWSVCNFHFSFFYHLALKKEVNQGFTSLPFQAWCSLLPPGKAVSAVPHYAMRYHLTGVLLTHRYEVRSMHSLSCRSVANKFRKETGDLSRGFVL